MPDRAGPVGTVSAESSGMLTPMPDHALLTRLETYYDAAPRATAEVVAVPGFTLFVARTGWRFYGRPHPGAQYDADAVRAVRQQLVDHSVPDQLEWVDELVPTLRPAAARAGMTVHDNPLLVLHQALPIPSPPGVVVEVLDPDDRRVGDAQAAVAAGFKGTDDKAPEPGAEVLRDRAREGLLVMVGAFEHGEAVGGGTHAPRDGVTELLGIATLPRARHRGIGAAITSALARDAMAGGATTIFLSAGSDAVARVYERVGFVRVGTACVAEG